MPKELYTKTRLPNGMRVILAPLSETQAVTVLVMTKVGSRYETATTSGVSHFLEHMMFKGTEKRPTAKEVTRELDRVGAEFNAFTSKDTTGYYIKLEHKNFGLALDIIADMLWHSKFLQEEIDRERGVIIEEINMYEDNPMMIVEDLLEELMYGATHPLGRLIAGTRQTITNMKRSAIVDYFTEHYVPRNMAICIAGNVPATAKKQVAKLFGVNNVRRKLPPPHKPFHLRQSQPRVLVQYRETEQVQLGMGFAGLGYEHKDVPALSLLSIILGGNMSSRLFTSVREREGLAYFINASASSYQDTGSFVIRSGLDKTRIVPAVRLIVSELETVRMNGVSEEELTHAKDFLRGRLTLKLEDSEQIADFLIRQEVLLGEIKTPIERLAAINKVTREDIARVARNVIRPKHVNLVLLGPFKSAAPFQSVLRKWQLDTQ